MNVCVCVCVCCSIFKTATIDKYCSILLNAAVHKNFQIVIIKIILLYKPIFIHDQIIKFQAQYSKY